MKTILKRAVCLLLVLTMSMSFVVLPAAAAEEEKQTQEVQQTTSSTTAPEGYEPRNEYIDEAVPVMSLAEDGGKNARVLLVEDVLPWDSNANQRVLAGLTQFDKVTTQQFLSVDLSKYGVIVFANDQPFATYENYASFKEYMELFASIGGVIVFGACDAGWSNGDLIEKLPGDVSKKTHYVLKNHIADSTHPIVTGSLTDNQVLLDGDLTGSYCSHVSFDESSLPAGSKIILREDDSNRPTLVEYPLGKGRVIASGLTWEFTYDHAGGNGSYGPIGQYAKKAMDDMFQYAIRVSSIAVDDLAILKERYIQNNAHHVVVADKNSNGIKNASVTIDAKTYKTDANGEVIYSASYGVKQITVSAKGYKDNVQYYNLQPQQFRCVYLEKDTNDGKPYVTMVSEPSTFYDLRTQTKRYDLESSGTLSLKVTANWRGKTPSKYVIYQDFSNKSVESTNGSFSFSPGKVFQRKGLIWLKLIAADGTQSDPIKLNLYIDPKRTVDAGGSGEGLENMTSIKLTENKSGKVNDSKITSIFPSDFELKVSSLPIELSRSVNADGTVTWKGTIGIGKSNFLDDDAKWHMFKDDFETATKNTDKVNALFAKLGENNYEKWVGSVNLKAKLLDPEIHAAGYLEVHEGQNGEILDSTGGVLISGSNTSKLTQQFVVGPVPIYIDLSGKVNVDIQAGLKYDAVQKKVNFTGELGIGGKITVGGGLGVSGVVTVGAEGSAGIDIKILPKSKGTGVFQANITMYLLFVFDWKFPIAKKEIPLWGADEKSLMMALALDEEEGSSLSFASRDYASQTTEWFGTAVSPFAFGDAPESIHMLQDYVMPNTLPELVEVGGEHILLFHTDLAAREIGNNVVLMYSVYDDATDTWADPQPVCQSDSSDLYMRPFVIGDELYVAWQKVSGTVSADDADALLGQITERIDVSFAKWNKETESFEQSYVNSDDQLDMYPYLVANGDKLSMVWVANSENDATGSSGSYGFYVSDYADGAWSAPEKIFETTTYVSELAAGYVNGKLQILYAASAAEGASDIYAVVDGSAVLVSGKDYAGTSLMYDDELFYWAAGGKIAQYDAVSGAITEIKSGKEEAILPSYRIVSNETETAIVWLGVSEEGGSAIYASMKTAEGWSNPIALYAPELDIQYMDVTYEDSGAWNIICTAKEDPEENKVSLMHINVRAVADTSLDYLELEELNRVDGIQPVSCKITNRGQSTLQQVNILVKDSTGKVYYDAPQACSIPAGDEDTISFDLDLSDLSGHTELTISVSAEQEKDATDNVLTREVGFVDVGVDVEQYTVGDKIIFAATVTNRSEIPANVAVSIVEDSEDGIVLDMRNIGTLKKGSSYVHMFSIDRYSIDFKGKDHKYYYILVDTREKDRVDFDNKEIVALYSAYSQPDSKEVTAGYSATFTVDAEDAVKYKWQYRRSETGSWVSTTLPGHNTNTLTVPALLNRDGYQYRCRITTSNGTIAYTDPATMIVNDSIIVNSQPSRQIVPVGADATFQVQAEGEELVYQWQYRKNGEDHWKDTTLSGYNTDTLTVKALLGRNGYQYRCEILDKNRVKICSHAATLSALGFTAQPTDQTATVGTDAIFTVAAEGQALAYQWQYRKSADGSWMSTSAPGNKTPQLAVPATENKHGYQYRCRITDVLSVVQYSEPATLSIAAEITRQPEDRTMYVGLDAVFQTKVTGAGLTYQWQYRKGNEGGWITTSLPGADTDTLTVNAIASRNGYQYRCIATDVTGVKLTSEAATLTVNTDLTVHTQPQAQNLPVGAEAVFGTMATGLDVTYQWQFRADGKESWTDLPGKKTDTLTVTVEEGSHNNAYRCCITDSRGVTLYTDEAALTVCLQIVVQPTEQTACIGEDAVFAVQATGVGLSYKWQYRKTADGSWMSTTLPGYNANALTVAATESRNGYQYRCRITDATGATVFTDIATLVIGIQVTAQPAEQIVAEGENAVFTVAATGVGLNYKWQYRKTADGSWMSTTLPGYNTNTLTVAATESRNGYQYRCRITDAAGAVANSEPAALVIQTQITQQPADQVTPVSYDAVFAVEASGVGLSYKWQYRKTQTGSWMSTSLPGADTDTLTVNAIVSRNGYQYRCIVTDAGGSKLTSEIATLTVNTDLTVHTQPEAQNLPVGAEAVFSTTATGIGVTYQWQRRAAGGQSWVDLSGANAATLTVTVEEGSHNDAYRCCLTDSQGVTLYTDEAALTVCLAIVAQPTEQTACIGEDAVFAVQATGVGLSYQWQYRKTQTGSWMSTSLPGAKTAALTVAAVEGRQGYQYRCRITDATGATVLTDIATLVIGIQVTAQPADQLVMAGENGVFTVAATGVGISYQWQYRKTETGSWMSTSLPGNDTDTLTVAATQSRNGYQYRCCITDADGKTALSDVATLTVVSE